MIPKGAKHLHAAMLFIEYYLSDAGQKVLQKARYFPVMPNIKPSKTISEVSPRISGAKENYFAPETLFSYRKKALAILQRDFR
jgi:ABC-type Fe3+ transport system substrate-binding protein